MFKWVSTCMNYFMHCQHALTRTITYFISICYFIIRKFTVRKNKFVTNIALKWSSHRMEAIM